MKILLQKSTAFLLALVMLLTMLPVSVLAEDSTPADHICAPAEEISKEYKNGSMCFWYADAAAVEGSIFIQNIGCQGLMDQIDRVTEIAKGMGDFTKAFHDARFYESMKRIYPTDDPNQMLELLGQIAEEYGSKNGVSSEEMQQEILYNALVIYVAQGIANVDVDSVPDMIKNSDSSVIRQQLNGDNEDERFDALTQTALIYGMVYAFAHSEESNGLDIRYDSASEVWSARQLKSFLNYVDSDPGRELLNAYICALNMIDHSMYVGNEAVTALLTDGFGHTEFVSCLEEVFEALGHTCAQCGAALTPCIPVTIPGQEGSCAQDGLTDGQICKLCDKVLKEQTSIPASWYPCKDEDPADCVCDVCSKKTVTCGVSQPQYAGTDKAFTFTPENLYALIVYLDITESSIDAVLKNAANACAALSEHSGPGYDNLLASKGFLDFFSNSVVSLRDSVFNDPSFDSSDLTGQLGSITGPLLPNDSLTTDQFKDILDTLLGTGSGSTITPTVPSPLPLAVSAEDDILASDYPHLNQKLDKMAKKALTDQGHPEDQHTAELVQAERDRITANAVVLYAAKTAKDWDAEQVQVELKSIDVSDLSQNLSSTDDAISAKAIAHSGLLYMLYCDYVNSDLCSDPNLKHGKIDYMTVTTALWQNKEFRNFLENPLATESIKGALATLGILYTVACPPLGTFPVLADSNAVCELLVRGYADEELITLFEKEIDDYDHTCDVCGACSGDCYKHETLELKPTCGKEGMSKGSRCILCDVVFETAAPIPPTGQHEFEDGVCTVCETKQFDSYGTNMTLGNKLDLNFAFRTSDIPNIKSCYALVTKTYSNSNKPPKTEKIPLSECVTQMERGEEILLVTYKGIAAKEMGDTISVVIYNSANVPISKTKEDSVIEYVLRIFSNSNVTDWDRAMFVAMLNYGTEAQKHFNHNTGNPANGKLTDEHKKHTPQGKDFADRSKADKKYYIGTSLVLESNIEMQMGFKNITPDMNAKVSFTNHYGDKKDYIVDGKDFVNYDNKVYAVIIDELVVADARQPVTVSIYDGDKLVTTATDSIESYVARQDSSSPLFAAILGFADAAYDSFHEGEPTQ